MEPIYFSEKNDLFGLLYFSPTISVKSTGIILCYPFGQEYIRSHRAFKLLSTRLYNKGFPVLRFDYYGTGDSGGEEEAANLSLWQENIHSAINELKNRANLNSVVLIGLRLGASLALKTATEREDITGIVLWDPIIKGEDFIRELTYRHHEWLKDLFPKHKHLSLQYESLGFLIPPRLNSDLKKLNLLEIEPIGNKRVLVVSSENEKENSLFFAHLKKKGVSGDFRHIPGIKPWIKYEGLEKTLVPAKLLEVIVNWISEECS